MPLLAVTWIVRSWRQFDGIFFLRRMTPGPLSPFEFDLFISYSHLDSEWVKNTLIPKLRIAGIEYAIDFVHFVAARSFQSEMIRLMKASQRILIVLSSRWLSSSWAMFEAQSTRTFQLSGYAEHFIILRIEPCSIQICSKTSH